MNSSNEQYQIQLKSGQLIPIKRSEIHSVELIVNPQSQFQPHYQQQPIVHQEPVYTATEVRRMRDEQFAQRDLNISKAVVNGIVLLAALAGSALVVAVSAAIVLNAAKPQPTIVRECNGIFCFSQVDEAIDKA